MNRTIRCCTAALVAVALGVAVTACGSSDDTSTSSTSAPPGTTGTTAPATPEVTIDDPWARTSPMETTMGAVYLTMTSNVGDTLTGVSVPTSVAARAEIHETVMASTTGTSMAGASDGSMATTTTGAGTMGTDTTTMSGSGEMEMRPITELGLPPGETVAMKPGGYHIMLIELVQPLVAGDTVEVTLTFAKAGQQVVTATVRDS